IREKAIGKKHADYATNLNGLGLLYLETGNSPKAELYLMEALQIRGRCWEKITQATFRASTF
ncbi:MAG: tetratricopeptide repeat protein, partial [Thermoanaerobaculia bacterium]|nr:tetratricopeptide repeat protein [Thermoanaerobaculia bacterium]